MNFHACWSRRKLQGSAVRSGAGSFGFHALRQRPDTCGHLEAAGGCIRDHRISSSSFRRSSGGGNALRGLSRGCTVPFARAGIGILRGARIRFGRGSAVAGAAKNPEAAAGLDLAQLTFELDQYGLEVQTMVDSIFCDGNGAHGTREWRRLTHRVRPRIRTDTDSAQPFLRISVVFEIFAAAVSDFLSCSCTP
jgi:hypothetical protein